MSQKEIWESIRVDLKKQDNYFLFNSEAPHRKYIAAWAAVKIVRRMKLKRNEQIKDALISHLQPYIERSKGKDGDDFQLYFLERLQEELYKIEEVSELPQELLIRIMNEYGPFKFHKIGRIDWTPLKKKLKEDDIHGKKR